jgi:aryl-alcohol dehydrogenase-like predicted oxidoreductase
MQKRKLGKSNLEVSAIGVGCDQKIPERIDNVLRISLNPS